MKQLPPIFKVSNNIKDTNQKYYYEKVTDSIITLDNEVIPISTITSLEIKSPSE